MNKTVLTFFTILCLLSAVFLMGLAFDVQPVRAEPRNWTVDDGGPADFHSIQEAINAANEGDTVFVMNGTYYEHVVVNKTISLIGENRDTTIVDGKAYTPVLMYVSSDKVTVKGFMMRNAWFGIHLNFASECLVSNNNISNLIMDGISLGLSSNCSISNNNLNNNGDAGIVLFRCSNISVFENVVNNNRGAGLYLINSSKCFISQNTINNNRYGIDMLNSSSNNKIFHNNFIENTIQARIINHSINSWDDGYSSSGNFWSDYTSPDKYNGIYQNKTGYDWIGDIPYVIDNNNRDNYPLMNPYVPETEEIRIAYRNLLLKYTMLHSDLDALNFTLTLWQEEIINELNNIRNIVYFFMATTIILMAATVYFALRKPKIEP